MATITPKYGFKKPAQDEFYNIDDQNANWDKAEQELDNVNNKVTNLKAADIKAADGKNLEQFKTEVTTSLGERTTILTASGTANAITLPVTLLDKTKYSFKTISNSTGVVTINGIALKKLDGTAISNIKANKVYDIYYDQSQSSVFILAKAEGDATVADVLAGKVFSNGDDVRLVGTLTLKDLIKDSIAEIGVASNPINANDLIEVEKYKNSSTSYSSLGTPLLGEYRLDGIKIMQISDTMFISYGIGVKNPTTLFITTHQLTGSTLSAVNNYAITGFYGYPNFQLNSDKSKCIILGYGLDSNSYAVNLVSVVIAINKDSNSLTIGNLQTCTHAEITQTTQIKGLLDFVMLNENYGVVSCYAFSSNLIRFICISVINDIVTISQVLKTTLSATTAPSLTKIDNNTIIAVTRSNGGVYNEVYYHMIKLNNTTFSLSANYSYLLDGSYPSNPDSVISKIVSEDANYYFTNIYIYPQTSTEYIKELKLKIPKSKTDNVLTYLGLNSISSSNNSLMPLHYGVSWINQNDIIVLGGKAGSYIYLNKFSYNTKQEYAITEVFVTGSGYNTNEYNLSMIPFLIQDKPFVMIAIQTSFVVGNMYNAIYLVSLKHEVYNRGKTSTARIPAIATSSGSVGSNINYITT